MARTALTASRNAAGAQPCARSASIRAPTTGKCSEKQRSVIIIIPACTSHNELARAVLFTRVQCALGIFKFTHIIELLRRKSFSVMTNINYMYKLQFQLFSFLGIIDTPDL